MNNTNPQIFKAYDIRGIYPGQLNEETAYLLGLSYKKLREKEGLKENFKIVVAQDMRLSSPALKDSLIQGLLDSGLDIVDIGLSSTPTFYFAVAFFGYQGGIMVSASHNPAEYNGFKIIKERAIAVSGETGIDLLKDLILTEKLEKSNLQGKIERKDNVLLEQMEYDFRFADISKIKPLKIVADTANGMGAQYLEAMFEKLSCQLIKMNFELDGSFPNHEADPLKEENVKDLQSRVVKEKADLGIAIDGDGDRVFFIDDKGKTIEPSIIRGILAKIFLREKPGSKIGYDVRPGKITIDMINEGWGTPVLTRVGHSLIKEQMLKENIYFAGESSGHFFLNMDIGCFEAPVIMILKILQEFSQSQKLVSDYIKPFQKYFHSGEINFEGINKEEVFKKIEEKYKDANIGKLDGLSVEYPNFWFNVRGSNTESKIRLNLEAMSQELMEQKRDEVLGIINYKL